MMRLKANSRQLITIAIAAAADPCLVARSRLLGKTCKNASGIIASSFLILALSAHPLFAEKNAGTSSIPESSFAPLKADLAMLTNPKESSSTRRRACKSVILRAQALLEARPEAPNRYQALSLILKAQWHLLAITNSQRYRDAIFKTCESLAEAPDSYSTCRFEAELLLSNRDLSAKDAGMAERARALADLVKRYRDTPAELESLIAGIRIAPQLGAYDLKDKLVKDMCERFAANATAISLRRTLIAASMDIVFSGTFERLDGTPIVFPHDRLGHAYLAVFWSKDSELAMAKLKQLKEQQAEAPEVFEIYSFNLDELPDAGQSIIKKVGLKCSVLRLPGGISSETFRTYALEHPTALRVNHFGRAIMPPNLLVYAKDEFAEFALPRMKTWRAISGYAGYDRYLSQIQSLLIGDFLVADVHSEPAVQQGGVEGELLKAIRACFLPVPFRYRMSKAEALANYRRAAELSSKAIATYPEASDLWQVRNYRLIALLGMASLDGSSSSFQEAIKEARITAALALPEGAGIVARFCLAKEALRQGSQSAKDVVTAFIAESGGEKASLSAYSAACVLAIHADSLELYQQYRTRILNADTYARELVPFVAFLCDRFHQYYLFRGTRLFYVPSGAYRWKERRYMVDNGLTTSTLPLPPLQLKTLDGKTVSLPDIHSETMTLLAFVELPADGGNELSSAFIAPGSHGGLLSKAYSLLRWKNNNGLKCITVFLSDDVGRVKAIRDKYSLPGLLAVLPGGLNNPVVKQLGILSADRNVNTFLIRRNGSIAWSRHGIPYTNAGSFPFVTAIGLCVHIQRCDSEAGYRALEKKEYKKALQLFTGNYLLDEGEDGGPGLSRESLGFRNQSDSSWWISQYHGRAVANLGLGNHEAALADVETAIAQHQKRYCHDPDKPCSIMVHLLTTKARALDGLGRKSEARSVRSRAAVKSTECCGVYEEFENRLTILAKEIN